MDIYNLIYVTMKRTLFSKYIRLCNKYKYFYLLRNFLLVWMTCIIIIVIVVVTSFLLLILPLLLLLLLAIYCD